MVERLSVNFSRQITFLCLGDTFAGPKGISSAFESGIVAVVPPSTPWGSQLNEPTRVVSLEWRHAIQPFEGFLCHTKDIPIFWKTERRRIWCPERSDLCQLTEPSAFLRTLQGPGYEDVHRGYQPACNLNTSRRLRLSK